MDPRKELLPQGVAVPSLGRVVLFKAEGYEEVAALVTRVWGEACVDLTTFPPGLDPVPMREILYAERSAELGPGMADHRSWRWPPRLG